MAVRPGTVLAGTVLAGTAGTVLSGIRAHRAGRSGAAAGQRARAGPGARPPGPGRRC
ncbi:MAG TPA: hypothetical protein VH637_13385 [Streptosporangiaceae bacterium]